MLLQRLNEYADRLTGVLPPEYYRPKQIHWVLDIAPDGTTATLRDVRVTAKNRERAHIQPVPYVQRSGTRVPPYLLVDTAEFVIGLPKADKDQPATDTAREEAARRHAAYRDLALQWASSAKDSEAARALRSYFAHGGPSLLQVSDEVQAKDTVAVMVGTRWLHQEASAQRAWADTVRGRKGGSDDRKGLCLVCGHEGALLATIPEPVKKGAIPTAGGSNEGQLVSINKSAQGRGGVKQLANTPVCHRCGGRAMAVLNHLLASATHSRRFRDHGALVWWTREDTDDDALSLLFDEAPDPADVAHLIDTLHTQPAPHTAQRVQDNDFHALTLGLNNARVVVRDWIDIPLTELQTTVAAWYEDHGVYDGWKNTTRYVPLWLMALGCGRWDGQRYAKDSAPHGLEADLITSALRRTPPPARALPLLLQRIHADQHIDTPRIALLRLILNRSSNPEDHVMPTLDRDSHDPAYLCGRLFAVLEDIQTTALPDLNTTLRDKYLRTAATAPNATLTNLRIGANAHFKRLRRDNRPAAIRLERRLGEIVSLFTDDFPRHLTPIQQGRFVIGYEHERAERWAAIRRAQEAKQTTKHAQAEPAS
ncbi:type I-C CRISPR-associated protein Cas8c/Csd1 [Streptomyces sp. NPDC057062]|uniref:type I-C CRISPR-associated protein Cas8c/Csd1 n=1 Tax=Streptomyces sp. NPDC057062 TaxID=3346011 RepID=UPI0036334B27